MNTPKIFESEYRFCLTLWEHEPIKSRALARLCDEQLGWKVTTTCTVIRRLSERGVVKNEYSLQIDILRIVYYAGINSRFFLNMTFRMGGRK